ncbi:Binding-protein-dependent transport systems inner membrane component [Candidatus Promineifilum breve]|uniref:Binding-protein-dependent transport systems inner membrane component n=1 Tax=Candidatus Promineifilum breve TaxID=1806508 RepID=A0A160T2Z3_9CHLR|nr:ABC transporter permease [Candidatus Promineifilum breve]CUS02870.2 Binding-protein-dependent transport systems inner membrane component [Candidatus Promineifilum breve]
MTSYLIRRGLQMIVVVLLATVAIFALLNAVPGGPLSGLNMAVGAKNRLSPQEIARIEATLGLNKPFYLAYLTWLLGEDWVDEVGNAIGNPGSAEKMAVTGTWADFQSPGCQAAGGTNRGADPEKKFPCSRGVLRWDWGESWALARGQTVTSVIGSRIKNTLILMSTVTVISLLIAIPIGIISAVRQYSRMDYAVTTFSFFGISMPVFWFGLLMIILFTLKFREWGLPYFPSGDVFTTRVTPGSVQDVFNIVPGTLADRIVHLILPVTVLTLLYLAGWSRFMRSSMLEVLRQDYVRTARAKGLHERAVIAKHAARNALIPLITIVVFQIPGIFSGAILTETIFNYPGMGRLFIDALGRDDWPIVMAILFISAILVVFATLIGDILYTVVDPRIRFD